MAIQTTYPFGFQTGFQGMPYDLTPKNDVTGDATTAIEFGTGLVIDSSRTPQNNRLAVRLPLLVSDIFAGIAIYDRTVQSNSGTPAGFGTLVSTEGSQYGSGDPIRLRRRGRVYVFSEQAVSPTDPVFLRYAIGAAGTIIGNFRKDADTAKALQIATAQWVGTITAAGIVVLEVNLP